MQGLPKLSVRRHGGMTPRQCVAQAQAAEAAGLDGIAFAENPFNRGILPAAAPARSRPAGFGLALASSIPTAVTRR